MYVINVVIEVVLNLELMYVCIYMTNWKRRKCASWALYPFFAAFQTSV